MKRLWILLAMVLFAACGGNDAADALPQIDESYYGHEDGHETDNE